MRACVWLTSSLALVLASGLNAAVEPVLDEQQSAIWEFDVYLDDKPIGSHHFRLDKDAEALQILSEASFDVRILLVNVFSYRHASTERWQDGCLSEFKATTRQNKKRFLVTGEVNRDNFMVSTRLNGAAENAPLPNLCVKTFAYWNKKILLERKLLNNQTGDYESINVRELGATTIEYDGADLVADQYALQTPKGDIKLWYESATDRWLALEAPAKGNRVIRYQASRLPALSNAGAERPRSGVRYDF